MVRVEGADRMTLLELRTGRPATDTPDASIAHGRSTVITCRLVFNHLNPPVTIYFILDFLSAWIGSILCAPFPLEVGVGDPEWLPKWKIVTNKAPTRDGGVDT